MLVIVDYQIGNLGTFHNICRKIGKEAIVSSNPEEILKATKIILPGVGAFDKAMSNLRSLQLLPVLQKKVIEEKTPYLGICVGAQVLFEASDEGVEKGLGWIEGRVKKFSFDPAATLKVPHMGWNKIKVQMSNKLLVEEDALNARFYFVHSYHFECRNSENILGTTHYGYDFTSIVNKENIFGVQFHPEKSHKYGLQLIKSFIERVEQ